MDDIQKVEKLLKKNNGVIETYQVEDLGINNKILTRMIERGLIERVARETYIGADTFEDELRKYLEVLLWYLKIENS